MRGAIPYEDGKVSEVTQHQTWYLDGTATIIARKNNQVNHHTIISYVDI